MTIAPSAFWRESIRRFAGLILSELWWLGEAPDLVARVRFLACRLFACRLRWHPASVLAIGAAADISGCSHDLLPRKS